MWADALLVNRASAERSPSRQLGCCRHRRARSNRARS
jgi:hypothetical protein